MNNERKEKYLQDLDLSTKSEKPVRSMFERASLYEDLYQIDLCEFAVPQLLEMFSKLKWTKHSTFNVYRSLLRKYTQWCIDQGYCDAINAANHLRFEQLAISSIRNSLYPDEKTFLETIDAVYDLDPHYANEEQYYMIKSWWYLAWLGFTKTEALYVTIDSVKENSIETETWTATNVSPKIMKILHGTCELKEIEFYTCGQRPMYRVRKYADTNFIIRPIATSNNTADGAATKSTSDSWAKVANDLRKQYMPILSPYYSKDISFTRIYDCGRYVALKTWEDSTGKVATMANSEEWGHIVRRNDVYSWSTVLKSYNIWKQAFF